ncbi:MAG: adenosylcobinamide-GDP ribazoletransferase [Candidatus Binatia bacterium]|nr:adenosylcobinamide-GDP ribazoletransferase [Candidatus Binatia bacterium]MDG1958214.1 adenosylcobinamide-GDP ribazoletransferase [Candidatus Binatia bacterium]MDG2008184.1 adenosylcobinamide-GDP ribazoletransferase [Candidatus Binatia bacterium]
MSESEKHASSPASIGGALATLLRDGWCGLRFLLGWRPPQAEIRASVARGALFFPLFGAAGGSIVAEMLILVGPEAPAMRALLPVALLALLSGGRPALDLFRFLGGGILGTLFLAGLLGAEAWAFLNLDGNLRVIALVLAPMLGRWAYVVQAYGSLPARSDGFASMMVRHMQFTQFATASVCAMALSLMLINALGTLVLFLVASLSILLRIFTHRRQGGVSGVSLGAGAFLAEAGVVILIGSIARLAAGS